MGFALANGIDVAHIDLHIPRGGVWRGSLMLDSAGDLSQFPQGGRVVITCDDLTWNGTVRRSGVSRGTAFVEFSGGAGGFGKTMPAKGYRQTTGRIIVSDILGVAGERLSSVSDAGGLALSLPYWGIIESTAGNALSAIVAEFGDTFVWRVLPDGSTWFGADGWRKTDMTGDLLMDEPTIERVTVSSLRPSVQPGQTYGGRRVSYVDHEFTPDVIRTRMWLEDS